MLSAGQNRGEGFWGGWGGTWGCAFGPVLTCHQLRPQQSVLDEVVGDELTAVNDGIAGNVGQRPCGEGAGVGTGCPSATVPVLSSVPIPCPHSELRDGVHRIILRELGLLSLEKALGRPDGGL